MAGSLQGPGRPPRPPREHPAGTGERSAASPQTLGPGESTEDATCDVGRGSDKSSGCHTRGGRDPGRLGSAATAGVEREGGAPAGRGGVSCTGR